MILKACLGFLFLLLVEAKAQTLGPWVSRSSGVTNRLTGIVDGHAGLIAVGWDGVILQSADGVAWRASYIEGSDFSKVAYGNGIYVATGSPRTYWSKNARDWTVSNLPVPAASITFAEGKFWLGSFEGDLWRSTDATAWNYMEGFMPYPAIMGVASGWVVVDNAGRIFASPNGATFNWTQQTLAETSAHLMAVERGPAGWVVIGDSPNSIYTAATVDSWTKRFTWGSADLNAVAWGAGRFLVVGDRGTTVTSETLEGPWRTIRASSGTMRAVAFARGSFFAVGDNGFIADRFCGDPSQLQLAAEPLDAVGGEGDLIVLTSRAVGPEPLQYQWLCNDVALDGATSAELRFSSASVQDSGRYRLRVTSGQQTVFSREVVIEVLARPIVSMISPKDGVHFNADGHRLRAQVISDQPITNVSYFLASDTGWYDGNAFIASSTVPPYEVSRALVQGLEHEIYAEASTDRGITGRSQPIRFRALGSTPIDLGGDRIAFAGRPFTFAAPSDMTNFAWFKDGQAIAGPTGRLLTASAEGVYHLIAYGPNTGGQSAPVRLEFRAEPNVSTMQAPMLDTRPNHALYKAMAGGNSVLVGIETTGAMAISRDGFGWRHIDWPQGSTFRQVRFINGEFWALGAGGAHRSADGLTWTRAVSDEFNNVWNDIAWGDGAYVLVATSCVARSEDKTNWSILPISGGAPVISVAAANFRFVAIRENNRQLLTSMNGWQWVETTIPDPLNFQGNIRLDLFMGSFILLQYFGVVAGDGSTYSRFYGPNWVNPPRFSMASPTKLILVPEGAGGRMAITYDGVNFGNFGPSLGNVKSAVFTGGECWLSDDINGRSRLMRSHDGLAWSELPPTVELPFEPQVRFANGRFFLLGQPGRMRAGAGNDNWTEVIEHGTTDIIREVVFANGRFYGSNGIGAVWTSSDGVEFARQPPMGTGANFIFSEGEFLAFNGQNLLRSPDALSWTVMPVGVPVNAIAKGNGTVIAAAERTIYYSAGGGAFQGRGEAGLTYVYQGAAFGNDRFVVVGAWGGSEFRTRISRDGINWGEGDRRLRVADYRLSALTFSGGMFLLPGKAGKLAYSLDGAEWSAAQLPTSADLISAAIGNGRVVVTARGGVILQSEVNQLYGPVTMASVVENGAVEVRFSGTPGSLISLEESSSLEPGSWRRIHRVLAGRSEERFATPASENARFFRAIAE